MTAVAPVSTQPILIVEDSEDDFETTVRALKRSGKLSAPIFRCDSADDAINFLFHRGNYVDDVAAPRPGLVFLDLNMPGKSGKAVLEAVKGRPETRDIPIVVLTTSTDEKDIRDCYEKGANTYITKSVDLDHFVEVMRRVMEYWFEVAVLPGGDTK